MKGRTPMTTTVLEVFDRLMAGERDADAVNLLAEHGLPAAMIAAHEAGILEPSHWEIWKGRMPSVYADMVLSTQESLRWPAEVREWAAVVTVSGL